MVEAPLWLLRQEREPDPFFEPSERLFRRIAPSHLVDGTLIEAAIPSRRDQASRPRREAVVAGRALPGGGPRFITSLDGKPRPTRARATGSRYRLAAERHSS